MFEEAQELWKRYLTDNVPKWDQEDPRHDLGTEVRDRLAQLDIILDHLQRAIASTRPDPKETARIHAWVGENAHRIGVDMTKEEYIAGVSSPPPTKDEIARYMRAWDEIHLFSEAFYFFAWRLLEALQSGAAPFPGIRKIKARGITLVRNHLLQHPEKHGANYNRSLVVTSAGPVLKTTSAVVCGTTGRLEPTDDSVDRGLYSNAEELKEELTVAFAAAIGTQDQQVS